MSGGGFDTASVRADDRSNSDRMGRLGRVALWLRSRVVLWNVLVLAGGAAAGQAAVLLASPILTRLYAPEDLGLFAVYTSILSLLAVLASWRYELAIPLPDDDETAVNVLVVSILVVFGMASLTIMTVWLFGDAITRWTNAPALKPYLWLLPLSLLGTGAYQALSYWAIRTKAFEPLAETKVGQGLGRVMTQLIGGFLHPGAIGLLLGDMVGRMAGVGTLISLVLRRDRRVLERVSLTGMRSAAIRYRRFPMIANVSGVLNTAGLEAPFLLLAVLYGPQVAGWFTLGQRVIAAPMALIGQAVSQVYLGEVSGAVSRDVRVVDQLFQKTLRKLLAWGAIPIFLISLGGPWLFEMLFGGAWTEAGKYVRSLCLMFVLQFAVVPVSQTLNMLERQDVQLAWDAGRLSLVMAGFFFAGALGWSAGEAVLGYGILMSISYIALVILCRNAITKRLRGAGNGRNS